MMHDPQTATRRGPPFNTLEQLDQRPQNAQQKPLPEAAERMLKRAKRTYKSKAIKQALYRYACEHGSSLKRAYGRSLECTQTVVQESDGTMHTHYCGSRWCLTCNAIRTARAINAYGPVIATWSDAHFVTLTVQNCEGWELSETIKSMQDAFISCKRSIKRTHNLPFEGIRKLEITHNEGADTYHPHYHVIVEGEVQARALLSLWLERAPRSVSELGQDVRPVVEGSEMELFKYSTKLTTKGTDPKSLNTILETLYGKRIFQTFGFKLSDYTDKLDPDGEINESDFGTKAWTRPNETVIWRHDQECADWVDESTGECLTGFTPSRKLRRRIESIATGREVERTRKERRGQGGEHWHGVRGSPRF